MSLYSGIYCVDFFVIVLLKPKIFLTLNILSPFCYFIPETIVLIFSFYVAKKYSALTQFSIFYLMWNISCFLAF